MTELFISFTDGEGEIHIMAEGSVLDFDELNIEFQDGFIFVHDLDGQVVAYNASTVSNIVLRYNDKN